jgi:hypothetical protein
MLKRISSNITRVLLAGCLLFVSFSSKGQSKDDDITFWINMKYSACIDSGKSICHCQEQNPYLILQIDSARKISPSAYTEDMNPKDTLKYRMTIVPSIYRSWETLDVPITPTGKNSFSVLPHYDIDSGMTVNLEGTHLTLTYGEETVRFIKLSRRGLADNGTRNMRNYMGVFNSIPLLTYSIKPGKGGTIFLTHDDLINYIAEGRISVSCSDDFNYNEMTVEKNDSTNLYFFLVYKKDNTIELYKEPGRNRGDEIDTTKLKVSEIFFKKE